MKFNIWDILNKILYIKKIIIIYEMNKKLSKEFNIMKRKR